MGLADSGPRAGGEPRFGLSRLITGLLRETFERHPAVRRAVVYGSRGRGDFKAHSDIDLAVFAPGMSETEFARLAWELDDLGLAFRIDLVRADTLIDGPLKERIECEGAPLFDRPNARDTTG